MNSSISRPLFSLLSGRTRLPILTYHRVPAISDSMLPSEPSAEDFARQLDWIAANFTVLSLPEAAKLLREKMLPRRALCITFDDGYRNNYEVAAPLLRERGLTATFFIATQPMQLGGMWNDKIIEVFRQADNHLDLAEHGLGSWQFGSNQERLSAMNQVLEKLKYYEPEEREKRAEKIYASAFDQPLDLMMTPSMIKELHDSGFDIGGHTHTHPILCNLAPPQALTEIQTGLDILANVVDGHIRTFAYPNGRYQRDFDDSHMSILRDAGIEVAVSTEWGVATQSSNSYALPRFTPWERTETGWLQRMGKTYVKSYLN